LLPGDGWLAGWWLAVMKKGCKKRFAKVLTVISSSY
jgi:hypothetical protein